MPPTFKERITLRVAVQGVEPATVQCQPEDQPSGVMCSNSGAIMPAENAPKKSASDNRRSNKPIMEKRRRARINNCLNELKNLILDAMKKDPARHSKLEKADILEMTVRHLQVLQRHQLALAVAADPSVVNKYRAGFAECANEVGRFISRVETVDQQVKQRLLTHLGTCLNGVGGVSSTSASGANPVASPSLPSHAQVPSGAAQALPQNGEGNNVFGGLQLVPTRLPNGDIAFVVPSQYLSNGATASSTSPQHHSQPAPPPRHTHSTASPASPTPLDKPLELTVPRPSVSLSPISSVGSMGSRTPSSLSPASSEVSDLRMASPVPGLARPMAMVKSPRPGSSGDSDDRPWRPW